MQNNHDHQASVTKTIETLQWDTQWPWQQDGNQSHENTKMK